MTTASSIVRRTATAGTALTLLIGLSSPAAASSDPGDSQRFETDAATGAQLAISGEGDCDTLSVEVTYSKSPSVDASIEYDITDDCHVSGIEGTESPSTASAPSAQVDELGDEAASSCNWIHSSQTVQDIINIDIAKHLLNSHRCWDDSSTWMTRWTATSSTSVSWNHPSGKPVELQFDTSPAETATTRTSASFHSDWLWCNFRSDWQEIELRNTNVSYDDGTYGVTFWQSRSCPGTHMATASKSNDNPEW